MGALTVGVGNASGQETDRYNVGTASPEAEQAAREEAQEVIRVLDWGGGEKTVTGIYTDDAIEGLRNRRDVRYVEEDGQWQALAQTLEWGVDRIDADVAHANGETGAGADISIIDTGIDDDHPDLQANIADPNVDSNHEAYVDCRGSNCNYPWSDDNDHGTHCAGIADALNNSEGVVGVSTEATLHAVKVLDNRGSGYWSDVAAGIEWTADQGYDVGSMSLGGSSGSQTVKDACTYAYNNGVLLVAAAGNDGPCSDCVSYPAKYSECIAVSATSSDDLLAGFSSTGPEVELAGPGEGIYSTVIGGYDTFSGTSMACPHVAGTGGQLMANGYSNTNARDQMNSTAEDLGLGGNEQGNGLVDTAAALGLDSSDDLDDNSAPSVDSLSLTEVETDNIDAEFDADWQVSDSDGNLSSVDLTLTDDTDGETDDTASVSVSGDSASGTTRLVAAGDDGSGNSYTVELTVTDGDGATASDTASATESEDTSDGNAPTVDSLSLSEDNQGGSPHADFDASWIVSDLDGDLDTVDLTLTDLEDGETEDSASVDVSGSDASSTTTLGAKHEENSGNEYEVELVVTDSNGNTGSDTATEVEDGS
jgi:subtilisin